MMAIVGCVDDKNTTDATGQPDATQPDATQPDAAQPDAAPLDAAQQADTSIETRPTCTLAAQQGHFGDAMPTAGVGVEYEAPADSNAVGLYIYNEGESGWTVVDQQDISAGISLVVPLICGRRIAFAYHSAAFGRESGSLITFPLLRFAPFEQARVTVYDSLPAQDGDTEPGPPDDWYHFDVYPYQEHAEFFSRIWATPEGSPGWGALMLRLELDD